MEIQSGNPDCGQVTPRSNEMLFTKHEQYFSLGLVGQVCITAHWETEAECRQPQHILAGAAL